MFVKRFIFGTMPVLFVIFAESFDVLGFVVRVLL